MLDGQVRADTIWRVALFACVMAAQMAQSNDYWRKLQAQYVKKYRRQLQLAPAFLRVPVRACCMVKVGEFTLKSVYSFFAAYRLDPHVNGDVLGNYPHGSNPAETAHALQQFERGTVRDVHNPSSSPDEASRRFLEQFVEVVQSSWSQSKLKSHVELPQDGGAILLNLCKTLCVLKDYGACKMTHPRVRVEHKLRQILAHADESHCSEQFSDFVTAKSDAELRSLQVAIAQELKRRRKA